MNNSYETLLNLYYQAKGGDCTPYELLVDHYTFKTLMMDFDFPRETRRRGNDWYWRDLPVIFHRQLLPEVPITAMTSPVDEVKTPPLLLVLSSRNRFGRVGYDEAEGTQHHLYERSN